MYNLIKYAMQWYCQNLLITLSGHISVGFTDSCEDWKVSAVAGTVVPHHPMDLKRKNKYNRQVHSVLKMVCHFSPPLERRDTCVSFLFLQECLPNLHLFASYPKIAGTAFYRAGINSKIQMELSLPHAYIRMQSYDWWLYNVCSQMNSSKVFSSTDNANKYWFLSYWHTQVLQFILERIAP